MGWALEPNERADSHLVCEQSVGGGEFRTKIFTSSTGQRSLTGASFVVLDGALKSGDAPFVMSIVEDGMIVRMPPDTMEELIKSLLSGQDFELESDANKLEVLFRPSIEPKHMQGALVSPIDRRSLMVGELNLKMRI